MAACATITLNPANKPDAIMNRVARRVVLIGYALRDASGNRAFRLILSILKDLSEHAGWILR